MLQNKPEFTGEEKVAEVLDKYPHLEETFVEYGFKNILNPIMRKTVARTVSIKLACSMKNVDFETFLATLQTRS